jgi:hypothetical protein
LRCDPHVDRSALRRILVETGFITLDSARGGFDESHLKVTRLGGYQSASGTLLQVDRLTLEWRQGDARIVLDQLVSRPAPTSDWALTVGGGGLSIVGDRHIHGDDGMVYTVRMEDIKGVLAYGVAGTAAVPHLAWHFAPLTQIIDAVLGDLPL